MAIHKSERRGWILDNDGLTERPEVAFYQWDRRFLLAGEEGQHEIYLGNYLEKVYAEKEKRMILLKGGWELNSPS